MDLKFNSTSRDYDILGSARRDFHFEPQLDKDNFESFFCLQSSQSLNKTPASRTVVIPAE